MQRLLFRVRVTGESMWPRLVPGKTYWASSLLKPSIGKIIVFRDPNDLRQYIVKQIIQYNGETVIVSGTVSWSNSYSIRQEQILGVLIHV